ncbi:MAG: ATP-binding protein [Desulfurivibrio sp.]|nr:ATP-binding protein [Desulfurivibrio sp.]
MRQLIESGSEGNSNAFIRASEEVVQEERAKQHHLLANDLEKILYGRSKAGAARHLNLVQRLPVDRERNLPLLQVQEPVRRLEGLGCFPTTTTLCWMKFCRDITGRNCWKSNGLYPADRLLFCGPPGCGKTLTAEVLAGELGLPLATVRIDSVVSSFLGETAANLRQVFDFIAPVPMVVLFDEFDALAKERADEADHGELKRVVNAFLQLLDACKG